MSCPYSKSFWGWSILEFRCSRLVRSIKVVSGEHPLPEPSELWDLLALNVARDQHAISNTFQAPERRQPPGTTLNPAALQPPFKWPVAFFHSWCHGDILSASSLLPHICTLCTAMERARVSPSGELLSKRLDEASGCLLSLWAWNYKGDDALLSKIYFWSRWNQHNSCAWFRETGFCLCVVGLLVSAFRMRGVGGSAPSTDKIIREYFPGDRMCSHPLSQTAFHQPLWPFPWLAISSQTSLISLPETELLVFQATKSRQGAL